MAKRRVEYIREKISKSGGGGGRGAQRSRRPKSAGAGREQRYAGAKRRPGSSNPQNSGGSLQERKVSVVAPEEAGADFLAELREKFSLESEDLIASDNDYDDGKLAELAAEGDPLSPSLQSLPFEESVAAAATGANDVEAPLARSVVSVVTDGGGGRSLPSDKLDVDNAGGGGGATEGGNPAKTFFEEGMEQRHYLGNGVTDDADADVSTVRIGIEDRAAERAEKESDDREDGRSWSTSNTDIEDSRALSSQDIKKMKVFLRRFTISFDLACLSACLSAKKCRETGRIQYTTVITLLPSPTPPIPPELDRSFVLDRLSFSGTVYVHLFLALDPLQR